MRSRDSVKVVLPLQTTSASTSITEPTTINTPVTTPEMITTTPELTTTTPELTTTAEPASIGRTYFFFGSVEMEGKTHEALTHLVTPPSLDQPTAPLMFTAPIPEVYMVDFGGDMTQICSATGSPTPHIEWYKGNNLVAKAEEDELSAQYSETGITSNFTIKCIVSNDFQLISKEVQVVVKEVESVSVDVYTLPVSESEVLVKWMVIDGDLDSISGFNLTLYDPTDGSVRKETVDGDTRQFPLDNLNTNQSYKLVLTTYGSAGTLDEDALGVVASLPEAVQEVGPILVIDIVDIREDRARLEIRTVGSEAYRVGHYRIRINLMGPKNKRTKVYADLIDVEDSALNIKQLKPESEYEAYIRATPKKSSKVLTSDRFLFTTAAAGESNRPILSAVSALALLASLDQAIPTVSPTTMAPSSPQTSATTSVSDSTAASTTVEPRFPLDFISDLPATYPVTPGGNLTLNCSATGSPAPLIRWYRDDTLAASAAMDELSVLYEETDVTGEFLLRCVAQNDQQLITAEVQVVLQAFNATEMDNTTVALTTAEDVIYTTSAPTTEPPQEDLAFGQGLPEELSVEIGDDVNLPCLVTGSPVPRVRWTVNGNVVSKAETGQSMAVLQIPDVEKDFEATCFAYNSFNYLTKTVKITVKEQSYVVTLNVAYRTNTRMDFKWTVERGDAGKVKNLMSHISYQDGQTVFKKALVSMERSLRARGLKEDTEYIFQLTGLDAGGNTLFDVSVQNSTLTKAALKDLPEPELYFEASEITPKRATLYWLMRNEDEARLDHFKLVLRLRSATGPLLTSFKRGPRSKSMLLSVVPNKVLYMHMEAVDKSGKPFLRSTMTITTPKKGRIPLVVGTSELLYTPTTTSAPEPTTVTSAASMTTVVTPTATVSSPPSFSTTAEKSAQTTAAADSAQTTAAEDSTQTTAAADSAQTTAAEDSTQTTANTSTSAYQHNRTPSYQHANTLEHQHISIPAHQHICTTSHQHTFTSVHQRTSPYSYSTAAFM
ncbi:hypothetical protein PoB_000360000 [Plakobranchus ocellatus]|uniref:Ig-like domain-containing protein n=1 Tax=Plakobranchus ocellatus TaxID=259542 RepID=A0AAV3Y351_9GAST|nr:hypothetical protein PoB_000360000 [Plakobranchus ocellatus]